MCTNIPFCLPLPTPDTRTRGGKEKGLPAFVGSSFGAHDSEWIVCPLFLCPLLFFSSSFLHPFVFLVETSKEITTKSYSSILMLLDFCWCMWVQNSAGKYYQKTNTCMHLLIGKGLPLKYLLREENRRSDVSFTSSGLLWVLLIPTRQGMSVSSYIQFPGCPHWNDQAFIASPSLELLQRSRQILSSFQKLVSFLSRRPSFHSSLNQALPQFLGDGSIC